MSTPVTITLGNPDPNADPTTLTQTFAIIRANLSGAIETTFVAYVIGAVEPAVEDRDKAWHRLDGSGNPMGTYLYNTNGAAWRKEWNVPLGTIWAWNGNPAT